MRVVLITTGKMERQALGASLQALFPDVEFVCEPSADTPDELLPNSFTSSSLPFESGSKAEQNLDGLVRELAAAVEPGRKGKSKPALVILIDDLELANLAQPLVVQKELRLAIMRHMQRLRDERRGGDPDVVAQALRERASFHLMVPMVEAYLFGDAEALAVVTSRARQAQLAAGVDIEQFQVADSDYLAPLPAEARCDRAKKGAVSWAGTDRGAHPKKYLRYLCRLEQEPYCTDYRETKQGAAGLNAMRWTTVLGQLDAAPYARALIQDIADATGRECPVPGRAVAPTSIFAQPQPAVLRNL